MTIATWSAAIDRVVAADHTLGMVLAHARARLRDVDGQTMLIVRPKSDEAPFLRRDRADYEPMILAACAAVGLYFDGIAFVEELPA